MHNFYHPNLRGGTLPSPLSYCCSGLAARGGGVQYPCAPSPDPPAEPFHGLWDPLSMESQVQEKIPAQHPAARGSWDGMALQLHEKVPVQHPAAKGVMDRGGKNLDEVALQQQEKIPAAQHPAAKGVWDGVGEGVVVTEVVCSLRQTSGHFFEEKDKLGAGGYCDVFCGVDKKTGQRHALKILRERRHSHELEIAKEAEVLSKLNNRQVVNLIRQTSELQTGHPVLVLDYCKGGSLQSFLLMPENAKGLDDSEFLTLLRDVTEGLRYLRSMDIVHRDIKPGNILRDITPSGKSLYKLSDFGSSSQAPDTDQKCPLVGTEEYLHPVLYKNAFFKSSEEQPLRPVCGELWSLGCTLFHAIAGDVPFRPHGGARNNRKSMLMMISEKPTGAICGTQSQDGKLRWWKELPGYCNMSESLRSRVTPLLQNLMETDTNLQWSFETFLVKSEEVQELRVFDVLDAELGDFFRLYLHPTQSVAELQEALAFHTEVPAASQLLYHRLQPVLHSLGSEARVGELANTTPDQPLVIMSQQGSEGRCRRQSPAQPKLLQNESTLEEDYVRSFFSAGDLFAMATLAQIMQRLPAAIFLAVQALRQSFTSTQSTVEARFRVQSATCQERQRRLMVHAQFSDILGGLAEKPQSLKDAEVLCNTVRDEFWALKYHLNEIRRKAADHPSKSDTSNSATTFTEGSECIQHLAKTSREIWQRIQQRRKLVPLSEVEQLKHKGDKELFNQTCTEASKRMQEVLHRRKKVVEDFIQQKTKLLEALNMVRIVDGRLNELAEQGDRLLELLRETWTRSSQDLKRIVDGYRKTLNRNPRLGLNGGSLLPEDLPELETFDVDQLLEPRPAKPNK